MTVIIGISGKLGSGKNHLADELVKVFSAKGKTHKFASFAVPLKDELNSIMRGWSKYSEEQNNEDTVIEILSLEYNISFQQMKELVSFFAKELEEKPDIDAHVNRSHGVRTALQYLGTEIRRSVNENYWVELFHASVDPTPTYTFVTDVRFTNEADSVRETSGLMIRLEVPRHIIEERIIARDGIMYSEEALNHPSETSLDNYPSFDIILGSHYEIKEVEQEVVELVESKSKLTVS